MQTSKSLTEISIEPLIVVLHQLRDVLRTTSDEQYVTKPVGVVNSSMGGHVRHCLDHVDALLGGAIVGAISYDDRQRGTAVETKRSEAIEAIEQQVRDLEDLRGLPLDYPVTLRVLLAAAGPAVNVETTVGREFAFVLSHTVHHNALIAVIAKLLGVQVPERFGYAPSTLAYLEHRRCAR
jgi:hypothetical protein